MVFTQIFCQASDFPTNTPKLFQLNCNGTKKIVLLGLSYLQNGVASNKMVGLISNLLTVARGQYPYLIFTANQANLILAGSTQIEFNNVNLFGNIDILFVDMATGAFPVNFTSCVIYLDIIDIPNPELPYQHYKHPELKSHSHKK
jgi:hypothetical protein